LALAGKIDRARSLIANLPPSYQQPAAEIVFYVGHPVADAGDDNSAAPIMRLVIEFSPLNAMALYHAGVSEYSLGQEAASKRHLQRFLELYQQQDGWRQNALDIVGRLP
jgi:hypothetical protein